MRVMILLAGLVACSSKPSEPPIDKPPAAADATVKVDAVSKSSPIEGDPALAVVERAFKSKKPAFPLLSKDGRTAAVELLTPIGKSGGSTYSVGFITMNQSAVIVPLVSAKLMRLLLESMDTIAVSTFDIEAITTTAHYVTERLEREGFTRFDDSVDQLRVGDGIPVGPFRIRIGASVDWIEIELSLDGARVAAERVDAVPMGRVGDFDCVARPVAKRAWFHRARKRLLVQVGWNPGPDQCDVPDVRFRLHGPG
jgi:hypothetical protein